MAFSLMPSEIARLVYGYLLEKGCNRTAEKFLDESRFLKEFSQGVREGYQYTTKINDRSLLNLLNGTDSDCSQNDFTLKNSTFLQDDLNKISISLSNNSSDKTTLLDYLNHDLVEKIAASVSQNFEKSLDKKLNQCLPKSENSSLCTPNKQITSLRNSVRFTDSPRRKNMTPRRIAYSNNLNHHISENPLEGSSQLSGSNCETVYPYSSPISSSFCDSPDIEISIDRHLIYNECINNAHLQEMLANKINQKTMLNEPDKKCITTAANIVPNNISENDNNVKVKNNNESDLCGQIFKSLETDQKYNEFIDNIIEKELQSACFQTFSPSSNGTCTTSTSLNTPNIFTPDFCKDFRETPNKLDVLPAVKNLLNDLKTPEKINIYPVNSNTSIQISPPKGFEKNILNNINEPKTNNHATNDSESSSIVNNLRSASFKNSNQIHIASSSFNSSSNEIQSKMNNSQNNSRANNNSQEHANIDKYNRMKPVFANQHLQSNNKSGFSRLKALQKAVHESKNHSAELDSAKPKSQKPEQFNVTSTTTQQQAPAFLTTTIEKVEEMPNNVNSDNKNVQTPEKTPFQEFKPIELYLPNWSTTGNSSIIIPGLDKQGIFHLSSVANTVQQPQQQQVFYLNSDNLGYSLINCQTSSIQTIPSNSLETITYTTDANSLSMPLLSSNIPTTTTTDTVQNCQTKPTVSQTQSSATTNLTPQRTLPAILSKGKGKKLQLNSNIYKNDDTENKSNEQIINSSSNKSVIPHKVSQAIDNNAIKTGEKNSENTKLSRKSPILPKPIISEKEYKRTRSEESSKDVKDNKLKADKKKPSKKRKFDEIPVKSSKNTRNSSANVTNNGIRFDPKVVLDADFDKFLVNIYSNKK